MKKYTITFTVNLHINSPNKQAALEVARETLPSCFDVIDEEIKESEDQEEES